MNLSDVNTLQYKDKHDNTIFTPLHFPIFDDGKAPSVIQADAYPIKKGWNPIDNDQWNKGFPPETSAADGERIHVELQPYGAAKLRVCPLPTVMKQNSTSLYDRILSFFIRTNN